MNLERAVVSLVEKVERRFFGKYRGLVTDNADPEQLGRLRVRVPSVLGEDVVTGWALPCVPYGGDADQGFLFIPEVGAGVWVEFEEGDLEFPIWVGTFWSKPGGESELPKPNAADGSEEGAVQDPPTRKIIKTMKGHTIQIEDKDDEESVQIVEATNGNVVTMNKDGITITDGANGNSIVLSKDGIKITDGANTNEIDLNKDGVSIKDKSGNTYTTDSQGIVCKDLYGNSITMNSSSGFPAGPGIDLNGGKRVCLDGLINWLLSHQHVGNMGAPTPLFPGNMPQLIQALSAPGSGILSDAVKAK